MDDFMTMITIWLFNITMENGTFTDGLPNLKMGGFSMAMLKNQMVIIKSSIF